MIPNFKTKNLLFTRFVIDFAVIPDDEYFMDSIVKNFFERIFMKHVKIFFVLVIGILVLNMGPGTAADIHITDDDSARVENNVVILGSFLSYKDAAKAAHKISKKTTTPYSTRDMIYDKKEGLIWPKTYSDEIYAGTYYGRRSDMDCGIDASPCLTVERSDFYSGFEKDYYIIVGGVYDSKDSAQIEKVLAHYKPIVPDAYSKKTKIYMGCTR